LQSFIFSAIIVNKGEWCNVDINERFKEIRKNLELTQIDFGSKIGIAQGHITAIENGKRTVTNKTIKVICATFNINETWFRTGKGEMFNRIDDSILAAFVEEYNLNERDRKILECFLEMTEEQKENILNFVFKLTEKLKVKEDELAATILTSQKQVSHESEEERKKREWIEKVEREREEAHRMVDEEYDAKEKAEKVKRLLASGFTGDAGGMAG